MCAMRNLKLHYFYAPVRKNVVNLNLKQQYNVGKWAKWMAQWENGSFVEEKTRSVDITHI